MKDLAHAIEMLKCAKINCDLKLCPVMIEMVKAQIDSAITILEAEDTEANSIHGKQEGGKGV